MKSMIVVAMAVLSLMAACNSEKRWQVSGEWKEGEGQMVYLMKRVGDTLLAVDSSVVQQGKYAMQGRLERMDKYTLNVGRFQRALFLDDQPITVSFAPSRYDSTTMSLAVKGSREQELLAYTEEFMLTRMFSQMFGLGGEELVKYDLGIKPLVDSSLNLYTSAFLLEDLISTKYPFDVLKKQYEALAPEVKTSWMGVSLAEKIAAEEHIRVGGIAADIELSDTDGYVRKLSELRGKWVILDFWASWCGPCLKKFPELKAIYEEYRDAGLEIYGVSLDHDKDAWKKAIAEIGLPWLHVSSLKGWDCPVVASYRVTAVPKMFLLDSQGVIVSIDLPEDELRAKLDTLLINR